VASQEAELERLTAVLAETETSAKAAATAAEEQQEQLLKQVGGGVQQCTERMLQSGCWSCAVDFWLAFCLPAESSGYCLPRRMTAGSAGCKAVVLSITERLVGCHTC
jgi:hypothetical protein